MQPTSIPHLLYLGLFVGTSLAVPAAPSEKCEPRTLCIDGINSCGVRYGGCYDVCKTQDRPVAPLCVSTTAAPTTKSSVVPVTVTSEKCEPLTLCIDGVNSCGVGWGGCYDICKTQDRPVAPLCISTTSTPSTRSSVVATATAATKPTTRPQRPSNSRSRRPRPTTSVTRPTPVPPSTRPAPPVITTAPVNSSSCPAGKTGSGMTVCMDAINSCGRTYGGCFPDCRPWPTFTAPPCPTSNTVTVKPTQALRYI